MPSSFVRQVGELVFFVVFEFSTDVFVISSVICNFQRLERIPKSLSTAFAAPALGWICPMKPAKNTYCSVVPTRKEFTPFVLCWPGEPAFLGAVLFLT